MNNKLIIFGEGPGDRGSLPILVRKVAGHLGRQHLRVGGDFFEVGSLHSLIQHDKQGQIVRKTWIDRLRTAGKQQPAAILVVLDGDLRFPANSKENFCPWTAARTLGQLAADEVGAGRVFSLAIVFACKEYESWLAAGVESLAGKPLPNGVVAIKAEMKLGPDNAEACGKKWLKEHMACAYKEPEHQPALTRHLDIELVAAKRLRSFSRLLHAVEQLDEAVATGNHVCSPM